jgi:hypothetical protein
MSKYKFGVADRECAQWDAVRIRSRHTTLPAALRAASKCDFAGVIFRFRGFEKPGVHWTELLVSDEVNDNLLVENKFLQEYGLKLVTSYSTPGFFCFE